MIKKKILKIINDKLLNSYQHGIFPTIQYKKLNELITKIKAYDLGYNLIRVGPNGDGGYLIPNLLEEIKICFSPGVGYIHGFENDLLKRGIKVYMADRTVEKPNLDSNNYEYIKKNIGSYDDSQTITIDSWIKDVEHAGNFLLQMDVEGSEYEIINRIKEANLNKFKILVIEFHYFEQILTKIGYKVVKNVFEKILKYFDVAHIHPNNCCGSYNFNNIVIPSTLEMTFLRKDLVIKKERILKYPNKLDFKNVEKNKDIFLDKVWY